MVKINRRQFFVWGTAGVGIVLVGNWLRQAISSQVLTPSSAQVFDVYQSRDGLLELDLEAQENPVNLAGKQAYLLTYNNHAWY
jgi:hypothetical protein